MSVLIIDEPTKERIKQVREYAQAHRFDTAYMREIIVGTKPPPGDDDNFVVHFPGTGLRMVITLEEQPKGLMWHVSVSIPKPNEYASPALMEMLFDEVRLDLSRVVAVWLEPYGLENTALNVLTQAIDIDTLPRCTSCGRVLTQSDVDTKCVHCGFMPWS